ncbi:SRPBCC family protein [Nocardiopsis sp. RSe5-2]|uniref:SRPBCC family protein n=1 Tax=Nocardiopsis endophytica TaxID=3018445 RepID=A0ABT4U6B4_9ACTN|nr:SRPBCC family protein [Nocardiopsis endophytica]MDA2812488.1 SRPBCC family protein [Nocardiopsis endophytica]
MSMRLEHGFGVPVPVGRAWEVLLDPERVAPCVPGATLESVDGDTVTGKVRVKVGPITVTYRGQARFTEKDADARRVRIEASGKEARGSGTASASVVATLADDGAGATRVEVVADLKVTGRVAQFGRGVMADVSGRLVNRFAESLAEELASGEAAPEPEDRPAAPEPAASGADGRAPAHEAASAVHAVHAVHRAAGSAAEAEEEALDVLRAAGAPVLKRLVPLAAGVLVLFLGVRWLRRRGRRSRRRRQG